MGLSSCGIMTCIFWLNHIIPDKHNLRSILAGKKAHPDSMEDEGETLGRKAAPVTQGVHNSSL